MHDPYLGLSARRIGNECHAFVELFDAAQKKWIPIDLGGHACILKDQRPAFVFKKANEEKKSLLETPESKAWAPYYAPEHPAKEYHDINAVLTDLCQSKEKLLLQVPTLEAGRQLYAALAAHEATRGKDEKASPVIYVESVADLKTAWKSYHIDTKGTLRYFPGPLQTANKVDGLLVINWARFKPEEIATYKSILDTPPTFMGHALSPSLRVVNIATPETPACQAFYSRTELFRWPETIDFPQALQLPKPNATPLVVEEKLDKHVPADLYPLEMKFWVFPCLACREICQIFIT